MTVTCYRVVGVRHRSNDWVGERHDGCATPLSIRSAATDTTTAAALFPVFPRPGNTIRRLIPQKTVIFCMCSHVPIVPTMYSKPFTPDRFLSSAPSPHPPLTLSQKSWEHWEHWAQR
jgi:hypothetical protein